MKSKLVILAGGYGTRISEESMHKPKPMIEIGGKPILWHIMQYYSYFGVKNFIICTGYRSNVIKEYFNDFYLYNENINFDFSGGTKKNISLNKNKSNWNVSIIDTGIDTMTGGRLKQIKKLVEKDEYFFMTYGDGLSNINITNQISLFKKSKKLALISAVKQPSRFGLMIVKGNIVKSFLEKPLKSNERVNGGFFILKPSTLNLIKNKKTKWEEAPLKKLTEVNQLCAFNHNGFWHPMDTLRDKIYLEKLWYENKAPWKIW